MNPNAHRMENTIYAINEVFSYWYYIFYCVLHFCFGLSEKCQNGRLLHYIVANMARNSKESYLDREYLDWEKFNV